MGSLLPFFLMYLGGILAALPSTQDFLIPGLLPCVMIIGGIMLYRRASGSWLGGLVLFLLLGFGFFAPGWSDSHRPANHIQYHLQEGVPANVVAKISDPPIVFPSEGKSHPFDHVQYLVELVSVQYDEGPPIPVTGIARINNYSEVNPFHLGDIALFKDIRLKFPRNFKNPGRFDFRQYMHSLGIDVTGNTGNPKHMERVGSFTPSKLTVVIARTKESMAQVIEKNLSPEEGALLNGMVLGETQALSKPLQEAYKVTGLAHLLAVSGMNFTFLAAAIYLVFNRLVFLICVRCFPASAKAGHTRKIMALLCLPPILCYMILVGVKISSLRAGIMVIIFLLSVLVDRENDMFNSLLVSAFLILLVSPDAIINVSFQLSFMGVFIILYAAYFYDQVPHDPISLLGEQPSPIHAFIKGNILVTMAATLGTLPILMYTFNRISLAGVILNLFMVPLSAILMPLGVFVLMLGLVSQDLAGLLMPVCSLLLKLFIYVPMWVAKIPYASIYTPTPPKLWLVLYYFILLGIPYWLHKNRRIFSHNPDERAEGVWNKPLAAELVVASLWVAVWFIWPRFPEPPAETLTACVMDVGQGDSIFVQFPNHETLLIDGGGLYNDTPSTAKTVLAPFLWSQGIRHLDYMVATHSDDDHIAGLESLVQFFPVKYYLARGGDIQDKRMWNFRQLARKYQVELIPFEAKIEIGGATLTPLHPDTDYQRKNIRNGKEVEKNNTSLVTLLEYRTFSMLLTGDIGEEAEQYLIDKDAPLRANFLKVPHHGSQSSSSPAFIRAVSPRYSFISNGYLNIYRHPHPEVLERYKNAGANILRTDQQGALCVHTDGIDHTIETHEGL